MSACSITVRNKTNEGDQEPVIADFMLFQTVANPTENAYSASWKVAKVGCSGEVSGIFLPSETSFYVIDYENEDDPLSPSRVTGPYKVTTGQTLRIVQKKSSVVPEIRLELVDQTSSMRDEIVVINDSENARELEFALFKKVQCDKCEEIKVVSFKNVFPGQQVVLTVKPAIYICDVSAVSIAEGEDFIAAEEIKRSTKFSVDNKLDLTIGIFQKPCGAIYFREIDQISENPEQDTTKLSKEQKKRLPLFGNINKQASCVVM